MAPGIHPPCTPTASCAGSRCHPTPPPCRDPEKCLDKCLKKGIRQPCLSAVSILATRSKANCKECHKMGGRKQMKKQKSIIKKFLKRKKKEQRLKRDDIRTGGHRYDNYVKKNNKPRKRDADPCCQGIGHRGVLKKGSPKSKKKCTIL